MVNFRAVAANSPGDVWVVGDRGTIIHFDGTTWLKVSTIRGIILICNIFYWKLIGFRCCM